MNIDKDILEDINNLGDEDELHLSNDIANNKNQHNHFFLLNMKSTKSFCS